MKQYKLLFIKTIAFCFLFPVILYGQIDTAWIRRYNGVSGGDDMTSAIAINEQGNVYITGYSDGSGSSIDYATIKYNSIGEERWVARYNGPGNSEDGANAIAVHGSGNVYVTGYSYGSSTNDDYATIKYNSNGVEQWVARYNGTGNGPDRAFAIVVDNSENIYVTGYSDGNGSGKDYATIKYNSVGETLWVRRYNGLGNSYDEAYAIVVDGSGNVYVTGKSVGSGTNYDYATIKYNSNGIEQWAARYNGTGNLWDYAITIAVDGIGNVYVTGYSYGSGTNYDYATIKYNSNGVEQWVARYNGTGNYIDFAAAIVVDGQSNVYVTGTSHGSNTIEDYATIKYNLNGVEQWITRYNGSEDRGDWANAIVVDGSGNVYTTGFSYGYGSERDYATIKYNSNGVEQWVARYNGNGNLWDYAIAIAVDGIGNVYVTGYSCTPIISVDYVTIKYVQTQGIENKYESTILNNFSFEVYPNPAKAYFTIRIQQTANHRAIKIFDVSGKLVKVEEKVTSAHNQEVRISLKGINPGIYFLRIGTETKKFLVVK